MKKLLILILSACGVYSQTITLVSTNQTDWQSPVAANLKSAFHTINANFQNVSNSIQSSVALAGATTQTDQRRTTSTAQFTAYTKALDATKAYILDIMVIGKISGTSGGGVTAYTDRVFLWHNGAAWQGTGFTSYLDAHDSTAGTVATSFSGDNWQLKITPTGSGGTGQTDWRTFVLEIETQ